MRGQSTVDRYKDKTTVRCLPRAGTIHPYGGRSARLATFDATEG
ncbi:hypothetical protein [Actinomyces viscosus]|nr:hypothetical protein [Actinomyces viscosus]